MVQQQRQSGLQRTTQLLSSTMAVLRGHQRNVHQRHPHNTAVQCEWCTAWHAALLCSFRTLALTTAAVRSGTQVDPWPVGAAPDT